MNVIERIHENLKQESIDRTTLCNATNSPIYLLPRATTKIVNNVTLDPVYKDLPAIGDKGECVTTINELQQELYNTYPPNDKVFIEEFPYLYVSSQDQILEEDLEHSAKVKISTKANLDCNFEAELQKSRDEIAALKTENLFLKKKLQDIENTLSLMKYSIDPDVLDKEVFEQQSGNQFFTKENFQQESSNQFTIKEIFQQESSGPFSSKYETDLTKLRPKIKLEAKDEFINLNKFSESFDDELNNYLREENTNVRQIFDECLNKCVSEKSSFQCRICNYHCRSITMLENHISIEHINSDELNQVPINPDKLCITSEKSEIPDIDVPITRIRIYTKDSVYPCSECEYQSKTKYDLQCHMVIHGVELPYECQECNLKFRKASQLINHSRTHVSERPVLCSECGKTFISLGTYKRHLKIHSNEKPYACPTCEYRCYSKSNLKKHLKTHTGDRPFTCSKCNYKAIDNAHLNKHKRIHTGEKPYLCNECGKAFRANSLLKNHMLTHKEKMFACEMCGHKCTTKSLLKRHVDNNHSESKPYPCSQCDWKFAEKSDLKRHFLIHTGERPHTCQECGKRFRTVSTLNQHQLTHLNTLFKCSNCDYAGKTKLSLRMHMRREHGFYARDGFKFTYIVPPDNT